MKRAAIAAAALALLVVTFAGPALAARPGFVFPGGCCFYEGDSVRTVVPPNEIADGSGRDPFFAVMGGATGQKAVVGEAPGDIGYTGGHWAFYAVTWNTSPYLLTSSDAVHAAAQAGHVTVTRVPENDFLCPIQP
jgi:hypothetical protein